MSVKSDVLSMLERNRGNFFSGEALAEQLQVSRSAVWKAVKQLEKEGYQILAAQKKGYCMPPETDVLSEEGIRAFLPEHCQKIEISLWKETTSTNILAKQAAAAGEPDGKLFVAETQTAGKGRRGRSFLSIPGGIICMSLLLRPKLVAADAVFITTAVCVAVFRAIRNLTGIETQIKWVNDLYYQNRKICGILTEAVTDCETGMVQCVIPGIGINFNVAPEQFPEELKGIAGALYSGEKTTVTRNQLIAQVVEQVFEVMKELPQRTFLKEYKEHSMLIGKQVLVQSQQGEPVEAIAVDIDENGGLVIELTDGQRRVLSTGEVTVRRIE